MRITIVALLLLLASPAISDPAECIAKLVRANASLDAAHIAATRAHDSSQAVEASRLQVAAEAEHAAALSLCRAPKWFDPRIGDVPPKRFVVELFPEPIVDPWDDPALPKVVPVPGVPYLVDPEVEAKCPGSGCPIVVLVPAAK